MIDRSKFIGCLVGLAVGDAVGASFEGLYTFGAWEDVERVGELRYTDDTHMAIGVAESLITKGGFDGEHMAWTFVKNYDREPYRGYGPGPPRVFSRLKSGEAWDRAAVEVYPGGSYGNGAAMRVAPLALLYYDNPEKLIDVVTMASRITHTHELGVEGAVIQAVSVSQALDSDPKAGLDPGAFVLNLRRYVKSMIYLEKISYLERLLWGSPTIEEVATKLGNGIAAFESVPTAIYCFLSHKDSFRDCVRYAISLGGDTDSFSVEVA